MEDVVLCLCFECFWCFIAVLESTFGMMSVFLCIWTCSLLEDGFFVFCPTIITSLSYASSMDSGCLWHDCSESSGLLLSSSLAFSPSAQESCSRSLFSSSAYSLPNCPILSAICSEQGSCSRFFIEVPMSPPGSVISSNLYNWICILNNDLYSINYKIFSL